MYNRNYSEELIIAASQHKKEREYWMNKLSGELVCSSFKYDYEVSEYVECKMDVINFTIPNNVYSMLIHLSNNSDENLHIILTACIIALLGKYTGNNDIIIGVPIYKTNSNEDYINTLLALRQQINPNMTLKDFIMNTGYSLNEAFENQNYPIEVLLDELGYLNTNRLSLFDVIILLDNINEGNYDEHIKANMIFSFTRNSQYIEAEIKYNSCLYKKTTVERVFSHFLNFLNRLVDDLDTSIVEIDIISKEEKNMLLHNFNITDKKYNKEMTISQIFEAQVDKFPENIALVYKNKSLTYSQLNKKSNQLARLLRKMGINNEKVVCILVDRSLEMLIGIMGILKAGGAYLPISPDDPTDRINYILEDSNTNLLLTQKCYIHRTGFNGNIIMLDDEKTYREADKNLMPVCSSEDLAYIIYTSGSTGEPKGVMVEHKSVINTLRALQDMFPLMSTDVYLLKTAYTFDVSVTELFGWFWNGGCLNILDQGAEKRPQDIIEAIDKFNITHINFVPSMLNIFLDFVDNSQVRVLNKLKFLFVAGEPISATLVNKFYKLTKEVSFINLYGPTESTIYATVYPLCNFKEEMVRVPIGKPIQNTRIYILDKNNQLQPIGVPGELCISGDGLARGYLSRTNLSNRKFVLNPFMPKKRMYRTGDLARWTSYGEIEFLGRMDRQIKVRGYRIELDEVEKHLLNHKLIEQTVLVAKDDAEGIKNLYAYIVSDKNLTVKELRKYLMKYLPKYMVPSYIIQLDKLPHTLSGKIDINALPEVEGYISKGDEYIEPRNSLEKKIVGIWKKVIGIDKIGIHDNFFDLGGNSLLAIKLEVEMEKNNFQIKSTDIFKYNTVYHIASLLSGQYTETSVLKEDNIDKSNNLTPKLLEGIDRSDKLILTGIEPFNEFFYKNCFYNSIFSILRYFNKDISIFLVNDVILYKYDKNEDVLRLNIEYVICKTEEDLLKEEGIVYEKRAKSKNIIEDIMMSISTNRPVIIWGDLFYESRDIKNHWAQTLLVYGYNKSQNTFNIIKQRHRDNLSYEKCVMSFEVVTNSYNGFLDNLKKKNEPVYYGFHNASPNEEKQIKDSKKKKEYMSTYLSNILDKKDIIFRSLECLEQFGKEFKHIATNESVLNKNIDEILEGINNIINAKQVEKYKITWLFNREVECINLIEDIIENWMFIRRVVAKYKYSSLYKNRAFTASIDRLAQIIKFEYRYYNLLFSLRPD